LQSHRSVDSHSHKGFDTTNDERLFLIFMDLVSSLDKLWRIDAEARNEGRVVHEFGGEKR